MSPNSGFRSTLSTTKIKTHRRYYRHFFGVSIALVILGWILKTRLTEDEPRDFLWESWKFLKQIFPLLVVGVFAVGVIRAFIRPEWIESLAGQNTLLGNIAGVICCARVSQRHNPMVQNTPRLAMPGVDTV